MLSTGRAGEPIRLPRLNRVQFQERGGFTSPGGWPRKPE